MFVGLCKWPFVISLAWTRFATPGTSIVRRGMRRSGSSYLTLGDRRCAEQRVASGRLCNRFGRLFETIVQQRRRRRRTTTTKKGFGARTKFNFQPIDHFQNTRPQPNTVTSVTCHNTTQNVILGRRLRCPGASVPFYFQTAGYRTKERCRKGARPG